jgi:hypothetical protein
VFWQNEAREYAKQTAADLAEYQGNCARFRGDMTDVALNDNSDETGKRGGGYANLTQLSGRIMRADFTFRNPQPFVKPPSSNRKLFTEKLARIETKLLLDFVQDADYYREMRRAALDCVLGAAGIVKINVAGDSETDLREMRRQRAVAAAENQLFALREVTPRVKKGDRHSTHIEEHARWRSMAQREGTATEEALAVMDEHIAKHEKAMSHQRMTESCKWERVTIERVHPENFACDPWAERPYAREWYKTRFNMRIEDAKSNPDFSRAAVEAITPCTQIRPPVDGSGTTSRVSSMIQTQDLHFQCHEVVDLVESKIVLYADGGTVALQTRPWTLGSVIPSGPFEECVLIEDPDKCQGVPPPKVSRDHQTAMAEFFGIATETTRRSLPMTVINGRFLDPETIQRIKNGDVAEVIVAHDLPPDSDLSKAVLNVPPCEVPKQNFAVGGSHGSMYDRQLGLGGPKLAGGDTSESATASALSASYGNALAEDAASNWDDFQTRVLRKVNRYHRAILPRMQVYEIVGDEALDQDGWPEQGFSDRDIAGDTNVGVVPGSTRRNDSPIVSKMLGEGIAMFQSSPLVQVMPDVLIKLYQRYFESTNQYGLGFEEAAEKMRQMQEQQALMQAQGMAQPGGQPGQPPGKPGMNETPPSPNGAPQQNGKPRPSEASTPSAAGQQQGMANVGGGRVGTGAGAVDPFRFVR